MLRCFGVRVVGGYAYGSYPPAALGHGDERREDALVCGGVFLAAGGGDRGGGFGDGCFGEVGSMWMEEGIDGGEDGDVDVGGVVGFVHASVAGGAVSGVGVLGVSAFAC